MPTPQTADDAAIREQAYYIWEAEGRPDGRESEFWMRAAAALADKPKSKKTAAAVKPVARPKEVAKPAPKLKAAASKTKAAAAKAEPAKKPKKK